MGIFFVNYDGFVKSPNLCVAVSADGCAYRLEKPHCVSSHVTVGEDSYTRLSATDGKVFLGICAP